MEKKNHNDPYYHVGFEYINKQGFKATIVEYVNNKNILVKFDDSEELLKVTGLNIKGGYPMHPTFGKVKVGDTFPCKDGDTVEVLEYVASTRVRCKWRSDGAEKWTELGTLRQGVNKHPKKGKYEVGQKVQTKNNGVVEVLEFISATKVLVKFENGETKYTTVANLQLGHVRPDNKFTSRVGHKFTTKSGWNGEVIEWKDAFNVKVKWQDGSESYTAWGHIVAGSIKPLFQPSVEGIGYIGEGRFIPHSYKHLPEGKEYAPHEIYGYWIRMLTRCYNENEQKKKGTRSYVGCEVAEEWHNFQNFAEWCVANQYCGKLDRKGKLWHLDKDILTEDNRVYRPECCTFVPNVVNSFFSTTEIGNTGYLGVNYIKPATKGAKEGYIARCGDSEGVRQYLGYYGTPLEAYLAYRTAKITAAQELADKWEWKVDDRVIAALRNFEERLPVDL